MSLHPRSIDPIPEATARVAHQAFPKGNRYLLLRDELGTGCCAHLESTGEHWGSPQSRA